MKYLAWAAFYEGSSDALYLDVLIPRVLRDILGRLGNDIVDVTNSPIVRLGKNGRSVEAVANEACAFSDAFDIVFIHADTGGRGLEAALNNRSKSYCAAMKQLCDWPELQCVTVTPRHETEAWLLSDGQAVLSAFGYNGNPSDVGLPVSAQEAERLVDPKGVLAVAAQQIAGRRRAHNIDNIFPFIAQRQSLIALRASLSFKAFEGRPEACLRGLQLID